MTAIGGLDRQSSIDARERRVNDAGKSRLICAKRIAFRPAYLNLIETQPAQNRRRKLLS